MTLEREAVGLIASSCVLLFLLIVACIVVAYICYRRLERNKLSKLPKYGPRDVSAWATDVSSTMMTYIDADADNNNMLHAYRPKMLVYPKDPDRRHRKHRQSRESTPRQDTITQVVENGRVVSVINVADKTQDADHETVPNGHSAAKPDGLYVYGHSSRLEDSEEVIQREYVVHKSEGKIVHGYMIQEDLHDPNGLHVTVEKSSVYRNEPPHVHGSADHPELVRGHVVKQTVVMDEDGHLAVTSSRQMDLNESTGFAVAHHEGPVIVYGHHSTHQDGRTAPGQEADSSAGLTTGHPPRVANLEQFPTVTHLALEGIAATGVSVSVPHVIVSQLEESQTFGLDNNDVSDDEDDDEEYDRKRKKNYKVIKKHSAYKVPDWVIKKVTEQEFSMDPETKDTVIHLEQRIGSGLEPHRESVSEIERRLSDFSASAKSHSGAVSPEAAPRRSAVTFGEVTHIRDAEILAGDDSDGGNADPHRRFYDDRGPVEDYLEPGASTLQTYTFPDGTTASVVSKLTPTSIVSHVLEIDHTRTPQATVDHFTDVDPGGSTLSDISEQIHRFSSNL